MRYLGFVEAISILRLGVIEGDGDLVGRSLGAVEKRVSGGSLMITAAM